MKKLLVCIHIYYHNQADYIIKKLHNITGVEADYYITYSIENKETIEKFLNFNPACKFFKVENKGFDVYPFLYIINSIDLKNYDYVLKLHTKGEDEHGGYCWRNDLFDAVLGSKFQFKKCIKLLNKKAGIIGSKQRITSMLRSFPENTSLFDRFCKKLNLEIDKGSFIAGTIFITKSNILQYIKNLNIEDADFNNEECKSHSSGTTAHITERLFSLIPKKMGYKLIGIDYVKPYSKKWKKQIIESVFSIKSTADYRKIYTVFGIKLKLNRYNYKIKGEENLILIISDVCKKNILRQKEINGLEIKINGSGNAFFISKTAKFENSSIEINSDTNDVIIEENAVLKNVHIQLTGAVNKCIKITADKSLENQTFILDKENETLTI